jgi:hypothetical protein
LTLDIGPEEFDRLTAAVGAKLAELTGMPLERAEELAGSSVGCTFFPDDEGMLTFTEPDGTPVVRLPASAFESILWGEDDEENPE